MVTICILGIGWMLSEDVSGQMCRKKGRIMCGIELTSALEGFTEVLYEYKISEQWSVGCSSGFNVKRLIKGPDAEEVEHYEEFSLIRLSDNSSCTDTHREGIWFSFWPERTFKGLSFCIGGIFSQNTGSDLLCSIGYRIQVWKGISSDISCNVRLLDYLNHTRNGLYVRLKIYFGF